MILKAGESIRINIDDPEMFAQIELIWEKAKLIHLAQKRIVRCSCYLLAGTIIVSFMALMGIVFSFPLLTHGSIAICLTVIPLMYLLTLNSKKWRQRDEVLVKEMEAFHNSIN